MPLERTWTWEFPVARERLWTYLGDTDWVNEHAGLPRISARYEPLPGGGTRRVASFKRGPFTVAWEERPTLWQAPEFHEELREYFRGPLRRFRSRTSLEPLDGDRTRVRMDITLEAASPLMEPLLALIAVQGKSGADRAFALAVQLASRMPARPSDAERALREFLHSAEDRDLRRMRPYELADRWKLHRRDVLRAFLSATRAGDLNLRWSILCPGCRGPSAGGHLVPFVVASGEQSAELSVYISAETITLPQAVADGTLDVSIENATDREALVRIEDGRWPDTIVTAAQVTALQEFRDLFSSEVLAPGLELGIQSIAVLFTDLVGSTAMYSRTGDAPAFRIVTNHFDVIREIVARYEGAIVKTIGDAVMAVFIDPANCARASVELDKRVQSVTCEGVPLRLRVGMHAGPCIAMRANDRIDYFGTTVNLAARLEAAANAGEVTMALSDAQRPGIAALLARFGGAERETLAIKGFPAPIDVVRLRVL